MALSTTNHGPGPGFESLTVRVHTQPSQNVATIISLLPEYLAHAIASHVSGSSGGDGDFETRLIRILNDPLQFDNVVHDVVDPEAKRLLLLVARHGLVREMIKVANLAKRIPRNSNESADGGSDEGPTTESDDDSDDVDEDDEDTQPTYPIPVALVLARAKVYEALDCPELAIADAYVVFTLADAQIGEGETDLIAVDESGMPLSVLGDVDDSQDEDDEEADKEQEKIKMSWRKWSHESILLLVRASMALDSLIEAKTWIERLITVKKDMADAEATNLQLLRSLQKDLIQGVSRKSDGRVMALVEEVLSSNKLADTGRCGWSQRVIYPWNDHEPDRMSKESLEEVNGLLAIAAPKLEVRTSILPSMTTSEPESESTQLGLYAKEDLAPGELILEERSALTAIRPHGAALCDACAADLETIPKHEQRSCTGCGRPFCSDACHDAAREKYHVPNPDDDETEEGYPAPATPFCPGSTGIDDLHTLGRAESSSTPEWDLYFLLLSRTFQMAVTQGRHPLDLMDIKYLWGDFTSTPSSSSSSSIDPPPKTLPHSLRLHVELPMQWFEVLMHSRSECHPYSEEWLDKHDWWIVQTLFAKFRGVADAQQSTWTGKPEVAGVHPLWCLANHSCCPNVTWKPSGVRNFSVVMERIGYGDGSMNGEWTGIKKGDEIWNHYTDVAEDDFRERRDRLRAVLGGDCLCERCVRQSQQSKA
ncbi:hypothetical protein PV10_01027 [Exophiala mesophila]|uniref:SET domain-containing protein n=1 Tax=Exophiala mesophila TaxID=212818 RepID=A0A0D1Y976_EXOME|nr:uncharacterized protein PV10_01027 [Exophiala mesophila]KIV97256.1 hypothetical protein PV10_01027 [Exophiala mesophila]